MVVVSKPSMPEIEISLRTSSEIFVVWDEKGVNPVRSTRGPFMDGVRLVSSCHFLYKFRRYLHPS